MNDLLKKIRSFMRPVDTFQVQSIIKYLGMTPSIKTLEEVLKHYKAEVKQILGKDLLEWMNDNDQVNFETDDVKVSIKTYVSSKMMDPEVGFKWLIDNQYGDLLKDKLAFPKGEFNNEAEKALEKLGLSYVQTSGIEPQSLKKIMSDRLKAGEMLPDEEENGIKIGYYDECVVREK